MRSYAASERHRSFGSGAASRTSLPFVLLRAQGRQRARDDRRHRRRVLRRARRAAARSRASRTTRSCSTFATRVGSDRRSRASSGSRSTGAVSARRAASRRAGIRPRADLAGSDRGSEWQPRDPSGSHRRPEEGSAVKRRVLWVIAVALARTAVRSPSARSARRQPARRRKARQGRPCSSSGSTQAQFAGYYAALRKGYYEQVEPRRHDQGRRPGASRPSRSSRPGRPEFGIDWLPIAPRDARQGRRSSCTIAQVFAQRGDDGAQLEGHPASPPIAKMRGKKVGVWCCGNETELFAALRRTGSITTNTSDVTIVNQPFDMTLFLKRQVDAAAAMTYNELAQVLETKNPKTGKLYTAQRPERVQDGRSEGRHRHARGRRCSCRDDWLKDKANQDIGGQVPQGVVPGLDLLP